MKVIIEKAEHPQNWYGSSVGKIFDVVEELEDYYSVHVAGHVDGTHFVSISDCQEVEDHPTQKPIDAHYTSFVYTLTEEDKQAGIVKVDPYFVSNQWQLGAKDVSGCIWHIFKTCARFGDKNSKEREILAIYKTVKRLAELEGVSLE